MRRETNREEFAKSVVILFIGFACVASIGVGAALFDLRWLLIVIPAFTLYLLKKD